MKRQEFLSELSICLLSLPDDIRKEICGDFNDHFIEGAERGLTEEEICRNLGQPSAIAEQFAEEYKSSGKDAGSPENRTFEINIPEITIPEISIPEIKIPEINIALTGSDSPRENRRNAPGSGEGDWNEPPVSVSVFDKNQFEIDIFKTFTQVGGIKVDLKNSNLTLRPVSQSESVTVKIKGLARHDRFAAENIDGKLHIIENAVRSPFDFFLNRKVKLDTVVTVPMGFCGDMEISVNNGTTDLSGICGSELRAKNNMKNITLDGCRFDRFDIQASFGNVIFLNCVAAEAKLRASAGEMRVSGCDCALDAHCSAGNLHVSGQKGDRLTARATAGNLTLIDCAGRIDASSSAGNVDVECAGKILGASRAQSAAGNVKVTADQVGPSEFSSGAGNVKIRVGKFTGGLNAKSSAGNVTLHAREIGGSATLHSSAGEVKIKLPYDADCRFEAYSRMGSVRNSIRGNPMSEFVINASTSMGSVKIEELD